jgi:putative phosphoesterase
VLVAAISDTHLAGPSPWFEAIYQRHLAGADLLVHCGDATGFSLWSYLMQHPNFLAVAGNTDAYDLADTLPRKIELTLGGLRVAAVHGWGPRPGLSERIAQAFAGAHDVIFFGHSHARQDIVHGSTRLINPGSLQPGGSLALVEFGETDGIRSLHFVDVS